ncbi:MAG: HAD family phosphatase [Flavitalea sp.]
MQNIKNVIFDLGGVILNIDFKKTEAAFKILGIDKFSDHISQTYISDFFEKNETGMLTDDEFVEGIQKIIGKPTDRDKIISAWNALLLDFPPERIELLKKIKTKYRLFLLSNTNSIHVQEFNPRLFQLYGFHLEDLFEKTYYSHVVNLRKPDAAIFELVLKENKLNPSETLFIDDTASNFEEARRLGIQIHHLVPGSSITEIGL